MLQAAARAAYQPSAPWIPLRRPPRRRVQPEPDKNEPRVNRRIRVPRVLVIDEEGKKLGEFLTEDAVILAEERGLDLIEVAPDGRPPVCKIADYGQMKYERKKRAAQARKNQVLVQIKEVKLRPKTDDHDMDVKIRHVKRFLEEGNKVKITVRFRGRELAHREIGAIQCNRVAEMVKDLVIVESPPRMDGRQMFMILAPGPGARRAAEANKNKPPLPPLEDLDDDDDDDDDDDLSDEMTGEEPDVEGEGEVAAEAEAEAAPE
jgi:translation initiation factor IF-3